MAAASVKVITMVSPMCTSSNRDGSATRAHVIFSAGAFDGDGLIRAIQAFNRHDRANLPHIRAGRGFTRPRPAGGLQHNQRVLLLFSRRFAHFRVESKIISQRHFIADFGFVEPLHVFVH